MSIPIGVFLVLSYVYSKQPIFGLPQEWLREVWSPRQGIIMSVYPLCGIPWHRHQNEIEGTNGFYVESQVFKPKLNMPGPGVEPPTSGMPSGRANHYSVGLHYRA